jgi:hypothetical protein
MTSSSSRGSRGNRKQGRLVLYSIPIIAIVLTAGVFGLSFFRPPPIMCSDKASSPLAMDFNVALSIQVVNLEGNQSRFLVPPAIGIPGLNAAWANHTLDGYGTNGISPLCLDGQSGGPQYAGYSAIRVRSTSVMNYTLRDFFNIWGQPLGRNSTDATLTNGFVQARAGYVWEMCIGNPTNPSNLTLGNWEVERLTAGKFITLVYYNSQSSYPGCIG